MERPIFPQFVSLCVRDDRDALPDAIPDVAGQARDQVANLRSRMEGVGNAVERDDQTWGATVRMPRSARKATKPPTMRR